jgi:hypothetical protein
MNIFGEVAFSAEAVRSDKKADQKRGYLERIAKNHILFFALTCSGEGGK